MRRLSGPGSIIARALKPLLALVVVLAAFAMAAPVAVAAPAHTDIVATSEATTGTLNVAPRASSDAGPTINAVFTCNWFSRAPFQIVDFLCQINAGVARVFLICSNGARVNSAPMPAVGTYNVRLICPFGTQVATINWESLA